MRATEAAAPRVCLVGPVHPFRGGIAHYTACLARALGARGCAVDVVNYRRLYLRWLFPGTTMLDHSAAPIGVKAEAILRPLAPWTWIAAGRHIRRFDPDVVVAQWWHVFFAPCILSVVALCRWRTRARVAVLCHNVSDHEKHGLLNAAGNRLLAASGASLIVHSERDAETMARLAGRVRVFVTQHPVYDVFRGMGEGDGAQLRRELGIGDAPLCLFFGVVRKYKGLEDLLAAMALDTTPRDARLLVAGEFYEPVERFEAMARDLGIVARVTIVNRYIPNEEVERYFAAADVVVAPYRSASQSGVVRIAQAFAKPAIVTEVGGLPEMVEPGRTGLVVPPGSPAALSEAIGRFFREGLGARFRDALEAQAGRFTWDPLTTHIERLAQRPSA
jgi:glycosyltransferase involved in cell wall biosynthesis